MELVHVSAQFLSASMPIIWTSTGIVTGLLAIVGGLYRWNSISRFIKRYILFRPQYDYRKIFTEYLDRVGLIKNLEDLYPSILTATCRTISARGASLLIRDQAGNFQVCASEGLQPFSFDINQVKPFLDWVEKKRLVVTRAQLVDSKSLSEIKSDGLRYCVQFNAEACVPLFLGETLYGILNIGTRKAGDFDRETRDLLRLLASYFTAAIRNVDLRSTLMRQNFSLAQAMQLRNRLLKNLSHELRTPLNSIIGLSELLKDGGDGPLGEDQKAHVQMIHNSGRRLLDTVNAIVDLSKIEANHLELNVQRINLKRLVGDVAESIPLNDGTKLDMGIADETPAVYGDEPRIRQVFKNLLDNAAKFTKRGKVSVDATKCGEMIRIRVSDTGVGIPEEKHEAVLEGFCQVDGDLNREHEGLGVGLSISKKIVELHGGRLWFNSKVGKGSNFYVTLPIKPTALSHQEIPSINH